MRTPFMLVAAAVTLASAADCQFPSATPRSTRHASEAQDSWVGESLETTILFAVGSSDLDGAAMQTLDALTVALSRARAASVTVEGLANDHHHLQTNLDLADRRAQAVARHLATRGIGNTRYVTIGRESSPDDPRGRASIIEPLQ
jgi:outer membrane protein OmpA-like peptidoglycan-associated protein